MASIMGVKTYKETNNILVRSEFNTSSHLLLDVTSLMMTDRLMYGSLRGSSKQTFIFYTRNNLLKNKSNEI